MRATFRNLFDDLIVAAFVRNRYDDAASILRGTLILLPIRAPGILQG